MLVPTFFITFASKFQNNGNINFDRFNTPEHAGLCSAGKVLIGAETIASYARASLSTGGDAGTGEAAVPSWQIDETQESAVQQWAESKDVWVPEAEQWLNENYGQMMAMA